MTRKVTNMQTAKIQLLGFISSNNLFSRTTMFERFAEFWPSRCSLDDEAQCSRTAQGADGNRSLDRASEFVAERKMVEESNGKSLGFMRFILHGNICLRQPRTSGQIRQLG